MTKASILGDYPSIPTDFALEHFLWGDPLFSEPLNILNEYVDDDLVALRREHVLRFIERAHAIESVARIAVSMLVITYRSPFLVGQ